MNLLRMPRGLLAGFWAGQPGGDDLPELAHAGEQWAPTDFIIAEHAHPVWEFYLQLDEVSHWQEAGGRTHALAPGGFFAAGPGVRHRMAGKPLVKLHFLFAGIDLAVVLQRHPPRTAALWRDRVTVHVPPTGRRARAKLPGPPATRAEAVASRGAARTWFKGGG